MVLEDGEIDRAIPLVFYKKGSFGKIVGLGVLKNKESLWSQKPRREDELGQLYEGF